ncbi:MAG: hypothetical protein FWG77_06600 [Treponema sp.]|nr:hypothetical protein [Treponema sp.]
MPDSTGTQNKKPRFFCEGCGKEVPIDGKKCPNCGKYFASVRCPSCGFIGDDAAFIGGCPICNYSASQGPPQSNKKDLRPAGALPFWVYILTAAAFTAVIAALFFRVF